jgi:hypothetical protein
MKHQAHESGPQVATVRHLLGYRQPNREFILFFAVEKTREALQAEERAQIRTT